MKYETEMKYNGSKTVLFQFNFSFILHVRPALEISNKSAHDLHGIKVQNHVTAIRLLINDTCYRGVITLCSSL